MSLVNPIFLRKSELQRVKLYNTFVAAGLLYFPHFVHSLHSDNVKALALFSSPLLSARIEFFSRATKAERGVLTIRCIFNFLRGLYQLFLRWQFEKTKATLTPGESQNNRSVLFSALLFWFSETAIEFLTADGQVTNGLKQKFFPSSSLS